WVGTFGGLARYNGSRFQVFGSDSGLSSRYITVVDSAPDGTVWVGTARGLCRKGPKRFRCTNPAGIDQLMVNDLVIGRGRVLVAADEGVFDHADGRLEPVASWNAQPGAPVAHALAVDGVGRVWVAAQAGLFWLDADRAVRVGLPTDDPQVYALDFHAGRLYAGTGGRLFALDPASGAIVEHELPPPAATLISDI